MAEIQTPTLPETIQITGGFGPDAIDPDVMQLRADFIKASGWHPGHTVPKPSMPEYPDSDPYDKDEGTLHLEARLGDRVLACVRATPVASLEQSLSWHMMQGVVFDHRPVEDRSVYDNSVPWDVSRLLTQAQLDHIAGTEESNLNEAVVATAMSLGAIAAAVCLRIGKIERGLIEKYMMSELTQKVRPAKFIGAVDPLALFITKQLGVAWENQLEETINGDTEPTTLVVHRDTDSLIGAQTGTFPLIGNQLSPQDDRDNLGFTVMEAVVAGALSYMNNSTDPSITIAA